jgi:dihydroorotate dehydrogenase (NAD+) catalytic subunit
MPKRDLELHLPSMNAAGMLGFTPNVRGPVDISRLGAFITNPVSLQRRIPAEGRTQLPFAGGFLLHTGWPNPGLTAVVRRWSPRWAEASLPIVLHLLVDDPGEMAGVAERLEGLENLAAVELGLPPQVDAPTALRLVEASTGELPLIACLPFEGAAGLAAALAGSGAAAFSLAAPRGTLPQPGASSPGPVPLVSGRLYGPGLLPQALATVKAVVKAAGGLPVFGSGGIYTQAGIEAMLAAGASAVQLDTALWCNFSF